MMRLLTVFVHMANLSICVSQRPDQKTNITLIYHLSIQRIFLLMSPGEMGTPYNGLYGDALSKRGTFSRLQVY